MNLTPNQIAELTRRGWFWTHSIDHNGNQCRGMVPSDCLCRRLEWISHPPANLPIFQTAELPQDLK